MDRRKAIRSSLLIGGGIGLFGKSVLAETNATTTKAKVSNSYKTADYVAYETTPPEIKARLCYNENPFGPSPAAQKAAAECIKGSYEYPFKELQSMASKIASYEKLDVTQVAVANGSTPYLVAAALHFGKGTILSATPTYEDLLSRAEAFGTKVIRVPLNAEHKFDLPAIEKQIDSTTSLIYICNPNNPTGTLLDHKELSDFCIRVSKKVPVMIDEAYIDLVPDPEATTLMPLVRAGHNIIIARTFSKLYGLAGMRVGYIVGQKALVQTLDKYTAGAFGISYPGIQSALASYQDKEFMSYSYREIMASKEYLYSILKKAGYDYVPTNTNFLIFPLKMKSELFVQKMAEHGVAVRSWHINGGEWCRVSIGTKDDMTDFAKALEMVG